VTPAGLRLAALGLVLAAVNPLAARLAAPRYATLPPAAAITVAARATSLEEVARALAPSFWQDPALPGGPLREVLFEGRIEGSRLAILYRTVWDDEVHPTPWMHAVYKPFRELYYGSARDVEYVELDVDLATGALAAVDYQTEALGRAAADFPVHERVLATGPGRSDTPAAPPAFRVLTWNHLLAAIPAGCAPAPGLALEHPVLRPLTDGDRADLRLARRTYAYLHAFGPGSALVELPIFCGAVIAALGGERLVARSRAARRAPPPARPERA
jgi:hypothetical protein